MDLRQIETFFWVATLGSFSATASRLNTTQPTISGRVIALEQELGVSLFDRAGRQIKLTAKGIALLEHATQLVQVMASFREVAKGTGELRRTVRMGVGNTIAHTWLSRLIQEIHRRYPAIDVDLQVDNTTVLRSMLDGHDIDLMVAVGAIEEIGVKSEFICQYTFDWVVSPKIDFGPEPVSLAELSKHRLITYPRQTPQHKIVNQLFRSHGVWPIRLNGSNSIAAMVQLAEDAIGVCAIPSVVVAPQLASGELRVLKTEVGLPPIDFFLSYFVEPLNEMAVLVADLAMEIISPEG